VRQLGERFESAHGREATSDELASLLGVSIERLEEHRAAAAAATLLQLDHVNATGDGEACFGERIEEHDAAFLPEEAIEQRELVGTVRTAVQHLNGVQREVVERYFFGGELLREIADSLGVTEARVSQIRGEALNAMRAYFGTSYDGVPTVPPGAPGLRRRAAFVATMAADSTWRSRFEAGQPVGSSQGVARSA
jgi:RNA polymerase sigma factor for flagellar operon FliA